MTDKELLEKAAHRFRLIADDTNRITSGNLSHNLTCLRGFALRAAESIEKHLQEEPISNDFEMALAEMIDKAQTSVVEPWVIAAQWKDELIKLAKSEETVSEGLEEAATLYAKEEYSRKNPATLPNRCVGCYAPLMYAFKAGAEWQMMANLWKPADGDDLPEYEREVVVFTQVFPDDTEMMRVAIGHRPNPDGWDGKSLSTGKVEHYIPKTYGKGGWNIPDVKFWLDVKLPKEIEP